MAGNFGERGSQYEEVLVKHLQINVPSFSQEDEMPVVGRKYHIACYGAFRVVRTDMGIVDPEKPRSTALHGSSTNK